MSQNASLGEFTGDEEGPSEPSSPSLVDRLLEPISPTLGLRLIPGDGDPFYLQNRGTEQYLFRDEHGRWLVFQPSADQSDEFVRWVYLPDGKPQTVARTAIRQRTVIGYDYVQRVDAPDPARSTVTAKFVAERFPESTLKCGSCGGVVRDDEQACAPLLGRPPVGTQASASPSSERTQREALTNNRRGSFAVVG